MTNMNTAGAEHHNTQRSPQGAIAPAVEATGLVKRYRDNTAVDGVSLSIRPGETFGILGTNGAGKSTTVEMIAGLRKPTEGTVSVYGLDPFTDTAKRSSPFEWCNRPSRINMDSSVTNALNYATARSS